MSNPDSSVRDLIVVIHGDSRNAPDHLRYVVRAATLAGVADAAVIAPQFLIATDVTSAGLAADVAYWTDGWKQGDASATAPLPRSVAISSFAALDQLIAKASSRSLFPNLRRVVVVGHSAGGQFVNRYAAASGLVDAASGAGLQVRFVVADPSSYLYFDDVRAHSDGFHPLTSTERAACSKVNAYKYGLERLNAYAAASGADVLRARYGSRDVVYLLGALDTSRSDPSLDTSCAANWQGTQRLDRGQTYIEYLAHAFGAKIGDRQVAVVVPGVGHVARDIYGSAAGQAAIFGSTP